MKAVLDLAPIVLRMVGLGGRPIYMAAKGGPKTVQQIQKKFPNARVVKNPTPSMIAQAKPFTPISGAGSRVVPSRAQQAERVSKLKPSRPSLKNEPKVFKPIKGADSRGKPSSVQQAEQAAQAVRSPKPQTSTSRTKVQAVRKPVRAVRKPVQAVRKPVQAVRKPVQAVRKPVRTGQAKAEGKNIITTRPIRPPAKANTGKGTTPAPRPASPARRNLNPAMRAAIAAMVMKESSPTGISKGKAETMPMPKPKAEEFDQKTPRKPAPVTPLKETTNFDAGKNTGFGPKGNIFPSSSEERAALMVMYGGTGSKAGKAAIAGTQGNLAKGQSLLDAAKNKKRSNVGVSSRANPALKKGGILRGDIRGRSLKEKQNRTKTLLGSIDEVMNPGGRKYQKKQFGSARNVPALSEIVQGTYNYAKKKLNKGGKIKKAPTLKKTEVVARQMRGWGKARKPKR